MDSQLLLEKLVQKQDLTIEECQQIAKAVFEAEWDPLVVSAILTALRAKGETQEELYAFAVYMREKAIFVHADSKKILDTCGTGGDSSHIFNVSTACAIVLASCGCCVAKHGNSAISSQSGSADVLQSLGVNIMLSPADMEKLLEQTNIAFLFAPKLHPVMKNIMPIRKALKIKTIFNLLGPLANPAKATHQIIGVPDIKWLAPFAFVLKNLGIQKALIVSSRDGLDEVSISVATDMLYLYPDGTTEKAVFDPKKYNLYEPSLATLQVKSKEESAAVIQNALEGKGSGAVVKMITANAGLAYSLYYDLPLEESFEVIQEVLRSGKAGEKLAEFAKVSQSLN